MYYILVVKMLDGIKKRWNNRKQKKEERKELEKSYMNAIVKMADVKEYDGVKVMYATRGIEVGLARDLGLTSKEDTRYVLDKVNNIGPALVKVEKSNNSEESLNELLAIGCAYGIRAGEVAKKAGFIADDSKATNILYNIGKKAYTGKVEEEKPKKEKEEIEPDLKSTIEFYEKVGADKFSDWYGEKFRERGKEEDVYKGIEDTEKYKGENVLLEPEHSKQLFDVETIGYLKEDKEDTRKIKSKPVEIKIKFKPVEKRYTEPIEVDRGKETVEDYLPSEKEKIEGLKEYLKTAKYKTGENIFDKVEEEGHLLKAVAKTKEGEMINVEYNAMMTMTKAAKLNEPMKTRGGEYLLNIRDIEELASK